MRTETQTVWIGEHLGPVDWTFDFEADSKGLHPEFAKNCLAWFRQIAEAPDQWEATTDGGWPRCGWGRVLEVGMYDGWPYWRPVPSFLLAGTLGPSWHSWSMLSDARRISGVPA